MNKRIRSMIDAIFCEMKMTAENLALRDELMANAQARFEDVIARGGTEEEAFAEVAASLEDVSDLLREMNGGAKAAEKQPQEQNESGAQNDAQSDVQSDEKNDEKNDEREEIPQTDLGDALNKAFSALESFGQSLMPQAKKFARQMDEATGGMLRDIGRAVNKGMQDAQKAAGEVLDRCQGQKDDVTVKTEETPRELRDEAQDLRAQADIKRAVGDSEGAAQLDSRADMLDARADAIEQEQAMESARREAEQMSAAHEEAKAQESVQEPIYGADGELDEEAFSRSVEQMSREAEEIAQEADDFLGDIGRRAEKAVDQAGAAIHEAIYGKADPRMNEVRFPVAGLRGIDAKLDADDVRIEAADGDEVIVRWAAQNVEGEPAVTMTNHTLNIRRKNPDVFKTFFSVFSKNGGEITVLVPRGYAADYTVCTTSGDVRLHGVDVDNVQISTTSGDARLEPDTAVRAKELKAETISGSVTISAMALGVAAKSVSGDVFISCDAREVKGDVVSGRLHIEGACDSWDVDAVSGFTELVCTVAPTGSVKTSTISGDVTLYLPGSIRGFAVELESMSGTLTNEFGADRYGTCALPIHMETISGRMIITRL